MTKVIDGDTIEVTGDRKVRFLGIDACEMSTQGGREAKEYLDIFAGVGTQVRLVTDGARNVDDHGRLLRRVERDSSYTSEYDPYSNDIGVSIVGHEAIGIYAGKNDASTAYLAKLRESDFGERVCSGTTESSPSGGVAYDGGGGDFNMPDGALTGGYCARKWWC